MTAYELETLMGAGMVAVAGIYALYALPAWIVRRCER